MINEGIGILFRMPVFIRSGIHQKNSRYTISESEDHDLLAAAELYPAGFDILCNSKRYG